jgi:hypothetical protein
VSKAGIADCIGQCVGDATTRKAPGEQGADATTCGYRWSGARGSSFKKSVRQIFLGYVN